MKVYYKQVQLNPTTATDYTDLLNKPLINGVELNGDQDTEQIKVTWFGTQDEFDALGTYSPTTFYIIDDGVPVGEQQDYLDLANKPSINGQVLTGNKLSSDLSMYTSDQIDNMLASLRSIKVVAALPSAPLANTMYYVGPDSEGTYMVYLFDSVLNRIDLGPSVQKLYTPGHAIQVDNSTNVIDVKYDDDTIKLNGSNELYANDATNTQKGVIKYDDNTIKKNSNGQLYTLPPIGAEIKVFDTSFDPNASLGNSTWTEIETNDMITTTFYLNKQSSNGGSLSWVTKKGTTITASWGNYGTELYLTNSTSFIPRIDVACTVMYPSNDSGFGIDGLAQSSNIWDVAQGYQEDGTKWHNFRSSNQVDGGNSTIGYHGTINPFGRGFSGKVGYSAQYTCVKLASNNNRTHMHGSLVTTGTACNFNFTTEVSTLKNYGWPTIYQRGVGVNTITSANWEVTFYELASDKAYKVWKRTA